MANPNFPSDGQAERVDALVGADGVARLKLGIGTVAPTGAATTAAWHGAATHVDGATAGASDGTVVIAGQSGTTVKHVLVDTAGRLIAVGSGAIAAAIVGNPVRVGGSDGTNTRDLLMDTSGHPIVLGGALVSLGAFGSLRTPDTFKTVSTAATGSTALWTPASGKKVRLMRFMVQLTANAEITGAAAILVVTFKDSATATNLTASFYVPGTAVTTTPGSFTTGWVDLGNGFLSATVNNALNVDLSATLSAGAVRVTVAGVEE